MALPSFTDIASQDEFKALPTEKKAELTETYWNDYARENPQATDYVQGQRQRSLQFLDTRQKLEDAPPIQKRFLEARLDDQAFELGLAEGAATGVLDQATAEAALAERQAEVQPRQQKLEKLQSLFTPEVDRQMQPAYKALEETAVRGGVFGSAPFSTDLNDVADRVIEPKDTASAGPRVQNQREYETLRNTFATDFGLEPAEVDSLIQHRLDLQPEAVSQDPTGAVHIKSELLAQHPTDVRKAILESNLPWSAKEELKANLPERIDAFKTQALATARKNYPELATELGIAQPSDDPNADFEKLTKSLNDTRMEQFRGGGQAGALGTAEVLGRTAGAAVEAVTGLNFEDNASTSAAAQRRRVEGINALSADLNRTKTQIFGTDAAVFGQAVENIGEAIAIGAATAGLGELFAPARVAAMGPRAAALAGAANRVAAVSPIAALSAGKQGIQTYENAIQSGKTQEEAMDLATLSGGIEFAVTAAMSGLKLGGTEDVGGQLTRQGIREAGKAAFPEFIKGTVKGVTEEMFEEQLINALDTALVQTRINPNLTNEQFLKSVKDTALVTLAAAGPAAALGAGAEAHEIVTPTHELTTDQLEVEANQILAQNTVFDEPALPVAELPAVDVPTAAEPGPNDLAPTGVPPIDAAQDVSLPAEGAPPVVEEPSLEPAPTVEEAVSPAVEPAPPVGETSAVVEPLQAPPETATEVTPTEEVTTVPPTPSSNETENQVEETSRPAPVEREPTVPTAEVETQERTPQRQSEGEKRQISAKNAATDKVLEDAGLPPIAAPARKALGTSWDEAQKRVAAEPEVGPELVRSLQSNPRALNDDVESGILLSELAKREEAQVRAQERLFKAAEGSDPEAVAQAQKTLEDARTAVFEARSAAKATGTAWGRAGRFRQVSIDEDYSLTAMEGRVRADINDGKPLSNAQVKEVAELHKTISDLQGRVREFETKEAADLAAQTYENALRKLKRDTKNDPEAGARRTSFIQDQAQKAKDRIAARKREGRLNALPVEDLIDYSIVGVSYIAEGAKTAAKFTARLVKDFGEAVRPFAKKIFAESKKREATKLPVPSKLKSAEEVVAAISPEEPITGRDVYNLARAYINNGIEGFENVMQAVHAELVKTHPDLTIRDVHDAFSNYGRTINPSKAEDKVKLREYRNLARLTSQLEDAQAGLPPQKTGLQRDAASERVRTLQKEVKDEMRRQGIRPTSSSTQIRSSLDSAKTRLRNEIEEISAAIRERKPRPEGRSQVEYDQEATDLRASRDKLREEYNEIFGKKEMSNRDRVRLLVKSMTRRIEEGDRQLAAGILSRAREPRMGAWSPELAALQTRLDEQRAERQRIRTALRPSRTPEEIAYTNAVSAVERNIAKYQEILDSGKSPTPTRRVTGYSPTNELLSMIRTLNSLKTAAKELRAAESPKLPREIAQKRRLLKTLAESVGDLERRVRTGDVSTKAKGPGAFAGDPLVDQLRQSQTRLRKTLAAMKRDALPKLSPEEARLRRDKKAIETRTRKIRARIEANDYDPSVKPTPVMDSEKARLQLEEAKAKREYNEKFILHKLAQRSTLRKAWDASLDVLGVGRSLQTSFDLGAFGRQGNLLTIGDPARLAKTFSSQFVGLTETGAQKIRNRIEADPFFVQAEKAGLYLADYGDSPNLTKMEEAYRSRLAKKIPWVGKGIEASERSYVSYLNTLRMTTFSSLAQNLSDSGNLTPENAKVIAKFVNIASGRGNLGGLENAANALASVFFSPKYAISRFQYLGGIVTSGLDAATGFQLGPKATRAARKLVAIEYAKSLTAMATIFGLTSLAAAMWPDDEKDKKPTIETDPRSSDFGKIKIGKTRIDLTGGLASTTTFLSRQVRGETKSQKGEIVDLASGKFGGDTRLSLLGKFLRGKLAPVPGSIGNALAGRDVVGEKFTLETELLGAVLPLSVGDIYSVMREQGVPAGTALSILTIFGFGVSTYGDDKDRPFEQDVMVAAGVNPARYADAKKTKSIGPKAPKEPKPPKAPKAP